jgi:DNA repair protein RecO (recombination protein O)
VGIKGDFEKIKRGYYVLELIDLIIPEGVLEHKLFTTLVRFLRLMERSGNIQNVDSLVRLFEWQILAFSGLKPRLEQCLFCKKIPDKNAIALSMALGGILCNSCSTQVPDAMKISPGSLIFIRRAIETDFVKGINWRLTEKLDKELKEIAQRYFLYHLGKNIKTAKFLAL